MVEKQGNILKSFSIDQIAEEIKKLQGLLSMYEKGDPDLPSDFNYKSAIYTLRYLRIRQTSWKKKIKKEENNE